MSPVRSVATSLSLARAAPAAAQPLVTAARAWLVPQQWHGGARRKPSLRLLSFVIVVVLPTVVASAYYLLVAADQFVAEFRFTLSTADPPRVDPLSLFAGNATASPAALESQVLVQYIGSRAIVDDLDRALDLRHFFAPPDADWLSRLSHAASIEELVRYWKNQVDPFYDAATGTVTVRLRAFAPGDALRLSEAVVAAAEKLVNDLAARTRRDGVRQAESDVAQSEARLKSVLAEIRTFREREGLIDPQRTAAATGLLATSLREQLVQAKTELQTLQTYMRDNAPPVRVLQARIRSLETQRRALAQEMTGPDPAHNGTLSGILGSYEELESEHKFAETAYQHALHSLDQARSDAERQHVFIASFVPPSLPEEALYPRRWRAIGTVALLALAVWAIGGLSVQSVRDHVL